MCVCGLHFISFASAVQLLFVHQFLTLDAAAQAPTMEAHPFWMSLEDAKLPKFDAARAAREGVKPEGGGSVRGQGRVGPMRLWRATHNCNAEGR